MFVDLLWEENTDLLKLEIYVLSFISTIFILISFFFEGNLYLS